jgi:hypothetical protein
MTWWSWEVVRSGFAGTRVGEGRESDEAIVGKRVVVDVSASKLRRFQCQSLVVTEARSACAGHCASWWSCTGLATRRQRTAGTGSGPNSCVSRCCDGLCQSSVVRARSVSQPAASRAQSNRMQVVCQARANGGRRPVRTTTGQQRWRTGRSTRARAPCSQLWRSDVFGPPWVCQFTDALFNSLSNLSTCYRYTLSSAVSTSLTLPISKTRDLTRRPSSPLCLPTSCSSNFPSRLASPSCTPSVRALRLPQSFCR